MHVWRVDRVTSRLLACSFTRYLLVTSLQPWWWSWMTVRFIRHWLCPEKADLHGSGFVRARLERVYRNSARFTCQDFKCTLSLSATLQKLQWDSLQQRRARSRVQMLYLIRSRMTWLPFPPQLTFNQLPLSPEDPKPDIGRSSAEPTHTVIPSFQVQCACGTHFLLMSASCHWTASRLNCTPSHWCRRLPALFYPLHRTVYCLTEVIHMSGRVNS